MWYYKKDFKQISAEPEGYAKPAESEKCIRYECERAAEGIKDSEYGTTFLILSTTEKD